MGRRKYLVLPVIAVTGLIGATPLDRGVQLPPITALAVTIQQGELAVAGYAEPEMRSLVRGVAEAMHSGTARLSEQSLRISGIAPVDGGFADALAAARAELPPHMTTEIDVFVIDASQPRDDACQRMFAAVSAVPAQFDRTGARLRSASQPVLDRIVDFAQDCREPRIELIGHSDASGPESANLALSLDRARTVADYLAARGVDGERLQLRAAGSVDPVADNATRLGRERNRRVEFRLLR